MDTRFTSHIRLLAHVGLLATSLVFSLLLTSPVQAGDPLTLAEYGATLDRCQALLADAALLSGDARAARLAQAAALLGAAQEVRLPSGQVIRIDNSALIDQLNAPGLEAARARLAALQSALASPPASADPRALARLTDILSNPPFKQGGSWLEEIIRQMLLWLGRLFGSTARGVFDARDLITLTGVVLVLAVALYFLLHLRHNFAAEAALPPDTETEGPGWTWSMALDKAGDLAALGEYRSAIRQLYLAALLLLDERRLLRYDRSLTNREYLRSVAAHPAVASALRPIVETFDRVWYGRQPVGASDFESYRRDFQTLRELRVAGRDPSSGQPLPG